MEIPPLPLADGIGALIAWMQVRLDGLFGAIKFGLTLADGILRSALFAVPPWATIAATALILLWRRRFVPAVGISLGLALILNLGLWRASMDTISLVVIAASLALAAGVPLGILGAESKLSRSVMTPVFDYMQTTPAFVYLIPAVLFFGVGTPPGVLATMMFALPPVARAVTVGLDQVNPQAIEAGTAFGASRMQLLFKIKLPLALPYFRAGVNQCVMMSLSMVVICSLVGARGLGAEVVTALSQMNLAQGIEAGLAVVLVAATLDRLFDPGGARNRP